MHRLAAQLLQQSLSSLGGCGGCSPTRIAASAIGRQCRELGTTSGGGDEDPAVAAAAATPSLTSSVDVAAAAARAGLPQQLPTLAEAPIPGVGGVPGPQLWLETLRVQSDLKLGLVSLDPRVFHQIPRPHVLHQNLRWQGLYRLVDYRTITYKTEVTRGHKKPWPQKGFGLARHGDRLAPQFFGGAQVKGPRGPEAYFYMLPQHLRVLGLVGALSAKCLQGDLRIVDSFDLPTDSGVWLQELAEARGWGTTVLFVSESGVAPLNMALACDSVRFYSLLPFYGLNVWSLLKHDTLVMTAGAAREVQARLLGHLEKCDPRGERDPDWDEPQATHFTGHYRPERQTVPSNAYY